MTLQQWLNRNFGVTSVQGKEIQFPCPKCHHPAFYFNLEKKIGYCHRNTCHFKPSMKDLNKLARFAKAPATLTDARFVEQGLEPARPTIELPSSAKPLVERIDGQFMSYYQDVVQQVAGRGVSPENQYRFAFHWDGSRVYIPIYFKGKLVNYVGRAAWWFDTGLFRYAYCPGANTRDYFFNWDQHKLHSSLVLVENTFNGIWLSDHCYATSNFGSDLSKTQIDLLASSKVKTVLFLWDEGAEWAAGRARERLKEKGIDSAYLKIKGQPDDYTIDVLLPWIEYGLSNVRKKAIIDTTEGP